MFSRLHPKKSKLKISSKTLGTQNQRPKTRPINPFSPRLSWNPRRKYLLGIPLTSAVFSAAAALSAPPPTRHHPSCAVVINHYETRMPAREKPPPKTNHPLLLARHSGGYATRKAEGENCHSKYSATAGGEEGETLFGRPSAFENTMPLWNGKVS